LSPFGSFRSFKFHARVQASLLSPCAWSPRSVLAVALPGSAARLAMPWWAWLALAGLRQSYRCTAGPPCLGATVAVVPHRAALASPSRRRLAGGCPGVAGTAPCGLGGQRASACCRVWGNSPSLLYRLSQLPLPELGDLVVPLYFFFRHRRHGPSFEPHPISSTSHQFAVGVGLQRPGPPPRPCS
jgi:hypothetical protein